MSLTHFIALPEVREKFSETFIYPGLGPAPELICEPKTKHYSLVGTAFDYLLRFVLETQNNNAKTQKWTAEIAVEAVQGTEDFEHCNAVLGEASDSYRKYISTKKLDDRIIKASLLLAQLDPIFRAGIVDPDIGKLDKLDIEDLRNLISSTKLGVFKPRKVCILNPTFGEGSKLVGGADADMVVDDTIIEIKTVKDFKLDRRYYNQLIGYYLLSRIGGIDGYDKKLKINNLGIYFSRYATFVTFKISKIMKGVDEDEFMSWFRKFAEKYYQFLSI
jgi:hypothetical protein